MAGDCHARPSLTSAPARRYNAPAAATGLRGLATKCRQAMNSQLDQALSWGIV